MQGSNYALIGLGYIAPRHLKAIKETGGNLIAALDKHDSVGILDSYFPDCHFFTEFELFDRYLDMVKIDYLVICSPNYLHDSQIRYGLKKGYNVICEKPLCINPDNLKGIKELETNSKVFTILQLRHHPALINLNADSGHSIVLDYCTPRGKWYDHSWKGDHSKSGGILMNIGVHLFDMLIWKFGKPKNYSVKEYSNHRVSGFLELEKAEVNWSLSIKGERKRLMKIDGKSVDFNDGFTELHTHCYKEIHSGRGFGVEDVSETIQLIHKLK